MLSMENVIAERRLVSWLPSGKKNPITIQISQPRQISENKWVSQVAVQGLYEDSPTIEGIDSFQTLNLAFTLVSEGLEQFIKNGGKLYWQDESGELSVLDIFS